PTISALRLGSKRMIDSAVADFPQPDSPTIARVPPASRQKLTPSTACTRPCRPKNCIRRSSTSSSAMLSTLSANQRSRRGEPVSETVLMQELTWPEIKQAIADGKTTAVLACGAVEQHGPQLPTGTDDYLGTAIAERAALIAGNALVAPTIRPGL